MREKSHKMTTQIWHYERKMKEQAALIKSLQSHVKARETLLIANAPTADLDERLLADILALEAPSPIPSPLKSPSVSLEAKSPTKFSFVHPDAGSVGEFSSPQPNFLPTSLTPQSTTK